MSVSGFVDYVLSSSSGNTATTAPTTVETVEVSNGLEACGNGNNGVPRGTTAYNSACNAIAVDNDLGNAGAMNEGARAPPRASSDPCW